MTRNGQIVKGIAGFYYVDTSLTFVNDEIYECKAKGNFRNKNLKPLVGDFVEIEIIDSGKKTGNIISVSGRKSELIRPAVSNVDRMILVFAVDDPAPNRNLIDRFLLMMKLNSVEVVLCINKTDICTDNEAVSQLIRDYHDLCGYRVLTVSAKQKAGMDELYSLLDGKTTALAGPSGVGKSTLLNALVPDADMETGEISRKIKRGKHTTRHSQVFKLKDRPEGTKILDTPGFSSIYIDEILPEDLEDYFPEMHPFLGKCRFNGCTHIGAKGCAVIHAVEEGLISEKRYENYKLFYEENKSIRRY